MTASARRNGEKTDMAGSTLGTIFRVTTWGESHGRGVGVVVDGCPAGLPMDESVIQKYLDRRKPGTTRYSTPRKEEDAVEIYSGIFEGRTTGTPISMAVMNHTQRSADYTEIASYYRPGHADYTFDQKYGFRDYRGGGRSSGRETIGRVAAGAVAATLLEELGISVTAYTKSIGDIQIGEGAVLEDRMKSPLYMPDLEASQRAEVFLEDCMKEHDSAGGVVECIVKGLHPGVGEPVFDKLDAALAKSLMSIGAVKGVEIGDGMAVAATKGSSDNDSFCMEDGKVVKKTNHAGGILGGISDGTDLILRCGIKPTPSIFKEQETINRKGESVQIQIKGRHDPVIVPRAVVVVETMTALTVADMLLLSMSSNMEGIKRYFGIDY